VFTTVDNGGAGVLVRESFNPMGVSGTGDTGDIYRGAGATSSIEISVASRTETTAINNFLVIGRGRGNNLVIHTLLHYGVSPDGVTNPFVDHVSIDCV
jgi:hypothetical protein